MSHTMGRVPQDCTCVWTIALHPDGSRSGTIFIVGDPCPVFPHPRRFSERTISEEESNG